MNISIVLTVISDDHPGVIQAVSRVLKKHGGTWTQSSMSTLAGKFAGILLASVPGDKAETIIEELRGLKSEGLRVIAHVSEEVPATEQTSEYVLDLVGNDRPGIVHDISTVLARHNVNVHDLETVVEGASMGGGVIFKARAHLVVPASADIESLEQELEDMANDLMVKVSFEQ